MLQKSISEYEYTNILERTTSISAKPGMQL